MSGRNASNRQGLAGLVLIRLLCVTTLLLVLASASFAGTWVPLSNVAPESIQTMLLLSDGTVMAAGNTSFTNTWYRLTPDNQGSYINGTWSSLASMHDTRLYYSSDVLTNGKVFVAGAEYGTGTNSAEVYDPLTDSWTRCPPPPTGQTLFFDSISKILPNGNVLIAPVGPATPGATVIYVTASNVWASGGTLFRGTYQDEASWVKLPDDSIITIDPFGVHSERYIPPLNRWINDSDVPVSLYDPFGFEMGAAFLLPNGKAFFIGSTGNTALYTPSGSTNFGAWEAGAVLPNAQGAPDAPAAMMANGNIICAVSPTPTSADHFPTPTSFYEYDSAANSFTRVNGPTGLTMPGPPYLMRMLDLPDGNVLFTASGSQLYIYQPGGSPLAVGKPAISNITQNANGSFHAVGTLFNGISEGAGYGDDAQMDSNYPIIRMTNASNGLVYYARTYGWDSTSVMTGTRLINTEFTLPVGLPSADYQLVVTANGISSDPVLFSTTSLPPIIITQPQNQTVVVSNNATFKIGVAGTPVTYTWRHNGSILPGATSSVCTFTNAQLTDSGDFFTCSVTNSNGGVTSSNAFLLVIPGVPPAIIGQPASVTAPAGGPASFSVVVTSTVPVSYFWERNGAFITGANSSTYTTNNVQLSDSGTQFRCLVTTIYGADLSSNATLTVVIGPSNDLCPGAFVITSNNYTNTQSTSLATSPGDPSPGCVNGFGKGVWYVYHALADGSAIADTIGSSYDTALGVFSGSCGSLTELVCDDDSGGNTASRTTNAIFAGTTYYYLCGGYGGASGNLVFHFKFTGAPAAPAIVNQPTNQAVPPGGTAAFTVTATGAAPLSYYWRRNGSTIAGATTSSYTTNNVQLPNSGSQFTCFVSNAYGSVLSAPATLTVINSVLQNGGFETGNFSFWTSSGNSDFSYVTSGSPYVHSGGYGAEFGPIGSLAYISQSVATLPGNVYVISCWLYCDGNTPNEFSVAWNGVPLFDQVNMDLVGWNNIQLLATAPASPPQLRFGFRNDDSFFGLDDIVVVPFARPAIQTVSQTNDLVTLTWTSVPGLGYQVQYTTDLSPPNWTPLGPVVTAPGNTTSISDPISNGPQRFYRVALPLTGP